MATFRLGERVHYVSRCGADAGDLIGNVIAIYRDISDSSEDGLQYDVESDNGIIEMAFSQELTSLETGSKISPRSSFTSELMLEDAIECFDKGVDISAERVVKALTDIKNQLKAERDHEYEIILAKRGRRA